MVIKEYLSRIPASVSKAYSTRTNDKIPLFSGKHNFFINSFFLSNVTEWNNLDLKMRDSETFSAFKESILKFIRPSSYSIFNCHGLKEIKLITRFGLGFSHIREHKFRNNSRILLIQFAVVEMTSRLQFITYIIVQII